MTQNWPEFRNYRIIREIARGGMGIVYEADQLSLRRRVALKTLANDRDIGEGAELRFQREARAAARLHHSNIVPVYEVGCEENCYYYAMQFIDGLGLNDVSKHVTQLFRTTEKAKPDPADTRRSDSQPTPQIRSGLDSTANETLAESLASSLINPSNYRASETTTQATPDESSGFEVEQRAADDSESDFSTSMLSSVDASIPADATDARSLNAKKFRTYCRQIADIGKQVASGLAYAHERGVIHRDIKPANLLLDTQGTVWIADFGLAKEGDSDLTKTGGVVGTLRFLAPERFSGICLPSGDIYALGLTLYEMLALRPAFRSDDRADLIKRILAGKSIPLRSIDPRIPNDLATIVEKAIEVDPQQRYQSADELHDDLERFLGDRPILARRISPVGKLVRWARRNRAIATLTAGLAVGLIALTSVSLVAANSFRQQARIEKSRADAEASLRENETQSRLMAENVRDFIVNSYGSPNRDESGKSITVYEVLKREVENIPENYSDDPLTQAVLFQAVGDSFESLSEYTDAIDALKMSIELYEQELGSADRRTVDALVSLTNAYVSNQDGEAAVETALRALSLISQHYADDAELMLSADNNLAAAYFSNGQDLEAVEIFESVVQQMTELYGLDDANTLDSMYNLIQSYHWLSRQADELELATRFLQISQQRFPADSLEVAKAKEAFASALPDDQLEQERVLRESVFEIRRNRLGDTHADTLGAMNSLAVAKLKLGETQVGLQMMEDRYQKTVAKYGQKHRSTVAAATGLGSAFAQAGNETKAIQWLEKALEVGRQIDPEDDPNLLNTKQGLAYYTYKNGDKQRALELNRDIFRHGFAATGFQTSRVKNALHAVVTIEEELKLHQRSLQSARQFHQLVDQLESPQPYRLVGANAALAVALYENGELEEAMEFAQATIDVPLAGDGFPRGVVRARAIKALIELKHPDLADEAERQLQQAFSEFEQELAEVNPMARWMIPRICEQAIARHSELGNPSQVAEWHERLSRVESKLDELEATID